jgi:hypothetical protein
MVVRRSYDHCDGGGVLVTRKHFNIPYSRMGAIYFFLSIVSLKPCCSWGDIYLLKDLVFIIFLNSRDKGMMQKNHKTCSNHMVYIFLNDPLFPNCISS